MTGGNGWPRAPVNFGATADMPGIMPIDGSTVGAKGLQDQKMDDEVFADPITKAVNGRKRDGLEWVGEGGFWPACDKLGRIPKSLSPDGTTCRFDDACVSSLPEDFYRQTLHPICIQDGKDVCEEAAGRPFCLPMSALGAYGGPIEVSCKQSGAGVDLGPEDPVPKKYVEEAALADGSAVFLDSSHVRRPNTTGCWWAKRTGVLAKSDGLMRHPGQIQSLDGSERGWYVRRGHNGVTPLTEEQALTWMREGKLPKAFSAAKASSFLFNS